MQLADFTIASNRRIAKDVYRIVLTTAAPLSPPIPGQFANIQLDGFYLRRPISVCDWEGQTMVLIYKILGEGTKRLARRQPGESLNLLLWLGNGYTPVKARRPVLIGGGVGVPPLYLLAKELAKAGQRPTAILGFNSAEDVFCQDEFAEFCDTVVTTADGSMGQKGFVTAAMEINYDALYTCGPEPMLEAVYRQAKELPVGHAQFSFERRMGCGFGACMVCSCKTIAGSKRICMEGPVLTKEEILWQ